MRFSLSLVAGVLLVLAGAELACRLLPVSSGARMAATTAEAPYGRYLPGQPVVYSFGWALSNARHSVINKQGFNNSPDMEDHANVLVIGDSFIESLMLPQAETVQGYLGKALHGGVYAAAASGNGLADSLQIARVFVPRIHPRQVVMFVEPSDVHGILWAPNRGHSAFVPSHVAGQDGLTVEHNAYQESRVKVWVLRSALIRYAYYNLKLPEWFKSRLEPQAPAAPVTASYVRGRQAALGYYLDQLALMQQQYGTRFIFLVDGDRNALYANYRPGSNAWLDDDRPAFLALVQQRGFAAVDMQPVFEHDWAQRRERLDFLPMDGHWNSIAHRLAAEQLLLKMRAP